MDLTPKYWFFNHGPDCLLVPISTKDLTVRRNGSLATSFGGHLVQHLAPFPWRPRALGLSGPFYQMCLEDQSQLPRGLKTKLPEL